MPTFDDEIDRTIDEVAREMTSGRPAPDLRARVLARIDAHPHERPYPWHPALAGCLWTIGAVAAALIIAIVLRGGVRLKPDVTNTSTGTGAGVTTTTTTTAKATTRTTRTETTISEATSKVRRPHRAAAGPAGAPHPSEVAALAPPPLNLDPLTVRELVPPPRLDVPQLEPITPIAVAPLEGDRP